MDMAYNKNKTEEVGRGWFANNLVGQSVIAMWGNKKQYIVKDIIFDKGPHDIKFDVDG